MFLGLIISDSEEVQMVDGEVDKNINLECEVSGYPVPTITWANKAIGSDSQENTGNHHVASFCERAWLSC